MEWWNHVSSNECFSLPLYPPGRPLVTAEASSCFPTADGTIEPVIYFLGCAANITTICLILGGWKRSQPRGSGGESIPRFLVLALCITELSFLVLGEAGWLVSFIAGRWTGGVAVYLYCIFVVVTCNRLSKCIVVLMGIERYLSIKKPFFYDNSVTLRRIGFAILAMLLYSVSLSCFFMAGLVTRTWSKSCLTPTSTPVNTTVSTECSSADTLVFPPVEIVYEYYTSLECALLTGLLIFCNIVVIRCMQKLKAHLEMACPRNREEYMKQIDLIRGAPADFSRLMVAIALAFVICILPYEIRWFANQLDVWYSPLFDYIAVRLYLSTSVINPLMYGVFRRSVRRKIRERTLKIFQHPSCCCGCKRKNRVRPQETNASPWQLPSTVSASLGSAGTGK